MTRLTLLDRRMRRGGAVLRPLLSRVVLGAALWWALPAFSVPTWLGSEPGSLPQASRDWRGGRVLRDIALEVDGARLHIGRLTQRGSGGLISAAMASSDGTILVEDISAQFGGIQIEIPSLTLKGTDLNEKQLAALFNPASAQPLFERLRLINADHVEADEITLSRGAEDDPEGWETTFESVSAQGLKDGKIASLHVASLSHTNETRDGATLEFEAGPYQAQGYDLAGQAQLAFGGQADAKGLIGEESSDLANITIDWNPAQGTGTQIKIAQLHSTGLHFQLADATQLALLQDAKPLDPARPDPVQMLHQIDALGQFFAGLDASFEAKNVLVTPEEGAPGRQISLGRIATSDIHAGTFGAVQLEDASFTLPPPGGTVRFAALELGQVNLSDALARLKAGFSHQPPDPGLRDLLPGMGHVVVRNLALDEPDESNGNSADGKNFQVNVGQIEGTFSNYINGVPSTLTLALDHLGLEAPKHETPGEMQPLRDWGLARLDSSAYLAFAFNDGERALVLNEARISDPSLGSLKLSGTVGEVSRDLFDRDVSTAAGAAFASRIKLLDLTLDNQGLVEKLAAMRGKDEGQSAQDMLQAWKGAASLAIPALLGSKNPGIRPLQEAVGAFLTNPKRLHVSVSAPGGLSVPDVVNIAVNRDLVDQLEIKAEAAQ